jgi:hypothetical protein
MSYKVQKNTFFFELGFLIRKTFLLSFSVDPLRQPSVTLTTTTTPRVRKVSKILNNILFLFFILTKLAELARRLQLAVVVVVAVDVVVAGTLTCEKLEIMFFKARDG